LRPAENPVALPVALESPKAPTHDPGLAAVIEAWPALPEAIKAGILAMVRAVTIA
jgi:hypothetical protein